MSSVSSDLPCRAIAADAFPGIVDDARKAIAEGRELPLPVLTLPSPDPAIEHRFGLTPDRANAVPEHLRTSSMQVEPATPSKCMSYEEAEERVRQANAWIENESKKQPKKDRPSGETCAFEAENNC